jgi:chemotaxis family two-component system response regulator Rcp1
MNYPLRGKPAQLLLVEDNPGDVRLTRETLKDVKLMVDLHVVGDGVEAMAFLRQQGPYVNAPRPDLVLLDLNLPKKDGREVLAEIKSDPDLKRIPVVVLTISTAEEDILKSYNLYANAYVSKPLNLEQFAKITKAIEDFWFTIVKLPPKG